MTVYSAGVTGSTSGAGTLVVIAGNPSLGIGSKVVTTAGTRVQLSAASVPCKKVTLQSITTNTGKIYIGDNTVSASTGVYIYPANSWTLTVSNLNLIYLDADNSGEGVVYLYEN